jgi:hypothetical protein
MKCWIFRPLHIVVAKSESVCPSVFCLSAQNSVTPIRQIFVKFIEWDSLLKYVHIFRVRCIRLKITDTLHEHLRAYIISRCDYSL